MNNLISTYIGFEGRLNRQRLWIGGIILTVFIIVISLLILPLIGLGMPAIGSDTTGGDVANAFASTRAKAGWVNLILFLIFLYPSAAISIKRRHDRNNNGYDVWIYFGLVVVYQLMNALGFGMSMMDVGGTAIPVPGPILIGFGFILLVYAVYLLVVLGFLKGTAGANNYGADPLQG